MRRDAAVSSDLRLGEARLRRAASIGSSRTNHRRKQDGDDARPSDRYLRAP
jgi:hypothetical protein